MGRRTQALAPKQHPAMGPKAHRVYRALVDGVLAVGALPAPAEVARRTGLAPERVARDWAGRDETGALVYLYPFSLRPTGIQVRLGEATSEAMCAIDTLGVAPMLGEPVEVTGTCTVYRAPLRLAVSPAGITRVQPATVAVVRRRTPGPAHLTRCHATHFVCSPAHGEVWLRERGTADDVVAPLEVAFARAAGVRRVVQRGAQRLHRRVCVGEEPRDRERRGCDAHGAARPRRRAGQHLSDRAGVRACALPAAHARVIASRAAMSGED